MKTFCKKVFLPLDLKLSFLCMFLNKSKFTVYSSVF